MKKILIVIVLLILPFWVSSQNFNQVKNTKEINWYGLDFTKAKMIGSIGFTNPDVICERYIQNKWNEIVFSEQEKYNISNCTGGKEVKIHLDYILKRNANISTENLIINREYSINEQDVKNIIKYYPEKEGIGLVFIVESFNKLNESANIWVTFFNNKSKEIYKTQKYSCKPGGFGVLNYWLKGVYETCKQFKKDYRNWGS